MPRKRRGERADGLIQVTYTDGLRPDGKPNRVSFYGHTRKEAEQKRDEYIEAQRMGIKIDKSMTVNAWIDKTVELYGLKEHTYRSYLKRIRDGIGEIPLSDVKQADIMTVLNVYKGKSAESVRQTRMLMNTLFKRAIANRLIVFNPVDSAPNPECVPKKSHRMLSKAEIEAVMAAPPTPYSTGAKMMLLTGMRKAELLALDWSDIDFENRIIHVHKIISQVGGRLHIKEGSKTDAGVRDIPICQKLNDILMSIPREHERLIVSKWKTPYNAVGYGSSFAKFGASINPDVPIQCHDLRHTYASMLYDAGIDIKSAQYLLGHNDINITIGLYTHLSEDKKRLSTAQINEHLDRLFCAVT